MAHYYVKIWENADGTLTVDNGLHGPLVYKKTHASAGRGSIQRMPEYGLSITMPNGDVYVHSEPTSDAAQLNSFAAMAAKHIGAFKPSP